ncbi:MAG: 2Fe-2S iron-sulfur cluster-binding protein [Maritimibacter sp.]|jgi:ferredoxin, 2Fe-2S
MAKITYVSFEGTETSVDLPEGWSLMQGATMNGIDGIEGECGGSCGCATCHCYIDDGFADQLEPISEAEEGMLEFAESERKPNSRLGCQIKVTAAMDGMVVHLPEAQ